MKRIRMIVNNVFHRNKLFIMEFNGDSCKHTPESYENKHLDEHGAIPSLQLHRMRTLLYRNAVVAFLALFFSFGLYAQSSEGEQMRTIFSASQSQSVGGYGAFEVGYTQINKLDAVSMGGRGMVILNHSLGLGLGGKAFISRPVYDTNLQHDYEFVGGYGGFYIEPIIAPHRPVHVSFPLLIGVGGLSYIKHWGDYEDNFDYRTDSENSNAFFVIEPGVELEMNLIKWMRFSIVGSYRYTSAADLKYKSRQTDENSFAGTAIAPSGLLRSYNLGIIMKFGKF